MAAVELRMPADIFDEMAGVREIVPARSDTSVANVNLPEQFTPVDENRLASASQDLFGKIGKPFEEYLEKLFKKLSNFKDEETLKKEATEKALKKAKKKGPAVKPIPAIVVVIAALAKFIKFRWSDIRDKMTEALKSLMNGILTLLEWAWKGLKWILKQLWKVIKWIGKKLWEFAKWLFKQVWKLVKWVLKKVGQLLKWLGKQLWKFMKWIMKGIKKILCMFWNVLKKLFHKTKKKIVDRFFSKEPKGMQLAPGEMKPHNFAMPPAESTFEQPAERAQEMVIKEVPVKPINTKKEMTPQCATKKSKPNQENIIWHLIKKVLLKFANLLKKLVMKIFSPLVKKIIKTVVQVVVQFFINLALSVLALAAAPIVAAIATAAMAIVKVTAIVGFVMGAVELVNQIRDDNTNAEGDVDMDASMEEEEIGGDDDDDETIALVKEYTMAEWRMKMKMLESQNKKNTSEHLIAKKNYIIKLIEEAESTGNLAMAERLRLAMGLPEKGDISTADLQYGTVADFNLDAFLDQERLKETQKLLRYEEEAAKNIIGKDELEDLLVAANGEPEWMLIVQRLITGVKTQLDIVFNKDTYISSAREAAENISVKHEVQTIKHKSKWYIFKERESIKRVDTFERYMAGDGSFLDSIYYFFKYDLFEDDEKVIEAQKDKPNHDNVVNTIFSTHGLKIVTDTERYRSASQEVINKNETKLSLWLSILKILKSKQPVEN